MSTLLMILAPCSLGVGPLARMWRRRLRHLAEWQECPPQRRTNVEDPSGRHLAEEQECPPRGGRMWRRSRPLNLTDPFATNGGRPTTASDYEAVWSSLPRDVTRVVSAPALRPKKTHNPWQSWPRQGLGWGTSQKHIRVLCALRWGLRKQSGRESERKNV